MEISPDAGRPPPDRPVSGGVDQDKSATSSEIAAKDVPESLTLGPPPVRDATHDPPEATSDTAPIAACDTPDTPDGDLDGDGEDAAANSEADADSIISDTEAAAQYMLLANETTSAAALPPLDVIPEDKIWVAATEEDEEEEETSECLPEDDDDALLGSATAPALSTLDVIMEDQIWDQPAPSSIQSPDQPVPPVVTAAENMHMPSHAQILSKLENDPSVPLISLSQYSSASDLAHLEYYNDGDDISVPGDDIDSAHGSLLRISNAKYGLGLHLQNLSEPVLARGYAGSRVSRILKGTLGFLRAKPNGMKPSDSVDSLESGQHKMTSNDHNRHPDNFSVCSSQAALDVPGSRRSSIGNGASAATQLQQRKFGRSTSRRSRQANPSRRSMAFTKYGSRNVSNSSLQSVSRPPRVRRGASAVSLRHCSQGTTPSDAPMIKANRMPWPCRECPDCRRHTLAEGKLRPEVMVQDCRDCRICHILKNGPTLNSVQHNSSSAGLGERRSSQLGAFCSSCRMSGVNLPGLKDSARSCSRMGMSSSAIPASNISLATTCMRGDRFQKSHASLASVVSQGPICRICHFGLSESSEPLFSPCRCSGSLSYVHHACLVHWLDICVKKMRKAAICELCHYKYSRHKVFRVKNLRWPKISRRDKMLQVVFVVAMLFMVACGAVVVVCFTDDYKEAHINKVANAEQKLSLYEILTLVAGVLFFAAFFTAMAAQVKARLPLHRYVSLTLRLNQQWIIDPYDASRDFAVRSGFLTSGMEEKLRRRDQLRSSGEGASSPPIIINGRGSAVALPQRFAPSHGSVLAFTEVSVNNSPILGSARAPKSEAVVPVPIAPASARPTTPATQTTSIAVQTPSASAAPERPKFALGKQVQ